MNDFTESKFYASLSDNEIISLAKTSISIVSKEVRFFNYEFEEYTITEEDFDHLDCFSIQTKLEAYSFSIKSNVGAFFLNILFDLYSIEYNPFSRPEREVEKGNYWWDSSKNIYRKESEEIEKIEDMRNHWEG